MLAGASAAPHPGIVPPCLAMLRKDIPGGEGWLFEVKLDGYRV
jgi:bifunctional non-homologous end joining protein LigD